MARKPRTVAEERAILECIARQEGEYGEVTVKHATEMTLAERRRYGFSDSWEPGQVKIDRSRRNRRRPRNMHEQHQARASEA